MIHKPRNIVRIIRNIYPINSDHTRDTHRIQVVNANIQAIPLKTEDSSLTSLAISLGRTCWCRYVSKLAHRGRLAKTYKYYNYQRNCTFQRHIHKYTRCQ